MLLPVVLTLFAGTVAGAMGALLGLGGGVFLVPFLNLVMGLPLKTASGISLITVIATSSASSSSPGRLQLVNLRLGMVLEIFTTLGGLAGVLLLHRFETRTLEWIFGSVTAFVSVVMLRRLDKRNVIRDASTDIGVLGGRYHEGESGGTVAYRVRRLPVAFVVSVFAGIISTLAGIGGGLLKVPALNAWCGVPIRPAAATSALMIGATAVVGATNYFVNGDIIPPLAAAAVLGALVGSKAGFAVALRTNARGLKLLMAVVLGVVAVSYFVKAAR